MGVSYGVYLAEIARGEILGFVLRHSPVQSTPLLTVVHACRMQHCRLGHNTYASSVHIFVQSFLRFAFPPWNVRVLCSPNIDPHNLDVLQERRARRTRGVLLCYGASIRLPKPCRRLTFTALRMALLKSLVDSSRMEFRSIPVGRSRHTKSCTSCSAVSLF